MKKSNSLPTNSLDYLQTRYPTSPQCCSLPTSPGSSLTSTSPKGLFSRLKRRFSRRIRRKSYHSCRRPSEESTLDFDFERERSSSAGSLSTGEIEVHIIRKRKSAVKLDFRSFTVYMPVICLYSWFIYRFILDYRMKMCTVEFSDVCFIRWEIRMSPMGCDQETWSTDSKR
jgi:hypothetical protein